MILIFSSCATYYFISLISHLLIINHCEPIEILRSKYSYAIQGNRSNILRSVATTTLTIFLIQILPLLLKIIEDLASDFNVSVIFSESYINSGFLDTSTGTDIKINLLFVDPIPIFCRF